MLLTCLTFGPLVALVRFAAACAASRCFPSSDACSHGEAVLAEMHQLAPAAAGSALVALFGPALLGLHPQPAAAFACGAAFAAIASPCGLGAVALAASLRAVAPAASAGFLCLAGIADLRALAGRAATRSRNHDALAYLLAACASLLAATRGGAGLLNPKLAVLLWFCVPVFAYLALRHRTAVCARIRLAPAAMLAGVILAAAPPAYHATETTLADAFPGERVDFTGAVTQTGGATTLVRYAITCCRADAAPVVVRLERPIPGSRGWMRVTGIIVQSGGSLRLRAQTIRHIPPPADPFVYR